MIFELRPPNLDDRKLAGIVKILKEGGVIVYPTDTVYSIGCAMDSARGIEKLCRLKSLKPEKARFAIICSDLTNLSDYSRQIDNSTFRLLKRLLPGPYTFILEAGGMVPRVFPGKRKTIGIRVPDHLVPLEIVRQLGVPLITTSLHDADEMLEYPTDPEVIAEEWEERVDAVVLSGAGGRIPSTVVDCTSGQPVLVREGKGEADW